MKILLIDGQRDHLRVSKENIIGSMDDIEIFATSTMKEALISIEDEEPDVIVSEYDLPDGDGLDILKRLKDMGKNPAFFLFTKEEREDVAVEALNSKVDRFIKKGDMDTADLKLLAQAIEQEHEHKVTKEKLRMTDRALKTLSLSNHLLVRAENEKDLLDGICRAVVKEGGYKWAWVGYRSETDEDSISPVAECSCEETLMDEKDLLWYKEDEFIPPIEAVRDGKSIVVQNIGKRSDVSPLLEEALERGYSSTIALPLEEDGKIIGSLNIYAEEPDAFDADELELLNELADDLSWGISAIRIRKKNEQIIEEIKKSRKLYRTIFMNTGTATMIVEEDTIIKLANGEFERITGYKPGELIGRSWTEFVAEEELEKLKEYHIKRREDPGSAPSRYETLLVDSSGDNRNCILNVRMIPGTTRSVVSILDITELKKIEKELRAHKQNLEELVDERTEQLRETNEDLEAFAHSVSHDLKEPVRAIQGFSQIIMEDCSDSMDEECEEYLKRIIKSSKRMEMMINDFLDYSQISRKDIMYNDVDIDEVMEVVSNQYDYDIREKGAIIDIDSPLGKVKGNEAMLTHIFSNLLSNSLKFVKNGEKPEVHIWSESDDETITINIEDTGIGIDDKDKETIFKMFERLHGEEDFPGTGIGLAIVKKGIERMGGKVGVKSKLGEGSRFRLTMNRTGKEA